MHAPNMYSLYILLGSTYLLVNKLQDMHKVFPFLWPLAYYMIYKLHKYQEFDIKLLQQCGWLPVRHLMAYHSLVLLHKTIKQKKPDFLYKKVTSGSDQPKTRQAASVAALEAAGVSGNPPSIESCELGLTRKSWCWSSVYWYNQLPLDLLTEAKIETFKTQTLGDPPC